MSYRRPPFLVPSKRYSPKTIIFSSFDCLLNQRSNLAQASTSKKMKYISNWHPVHRVPIVDGKFQNPTTGIIEEITDKNFVICGPPFIKATWIILKPGSGFLITCTDFPPPIEDVFVAIAEHVKAKAYEIENISATKYEMTVVCSSDLTEEMMHEVVMRMKRELWKDVYIPPEEIAAFEAFVEEERKKENPRF
ncbi:hypothetical protein ASPNIDRAFT_36522 [Aspergillus niger ATCC 1015]|uniref:Uncharacterized protein n=4 Tax=Aspergillus TaxID=5052 RepID=G3XTI4_ASPNA|nr:hypothetical protein ASPNIDRAFT_36522 [Aspergillus niger ATCC 1015]